MDEPLGRRELFMQAVKSANIPEIEAQLGADPDVLFPIDVNYYIAGHETPLIAAIQFIHNEETALKVITILLNAGADVNMRQHGPDVENTVDTYPLSLALRRGYYNVALALFKHNKLDLKPRYLQCSFFYTGLTPPRNLVSLFAETYARANDRINSRILKLFPKDVAKAAAYGQNDILKILVDALQRFMPSRAAKHINYALHSVGSAAAVYTLIEAGAKVNKKCRIGKTPLMANYEKSYIHFQTEESQTSVALALMRSGADVNLFDKSGKTALVYAILANNHGMELVQLGKRIDDLLNFGAQQSVNRRDKWGHTALMFAADAYSYAFNSEAIAKLIAVGADHDKLSNKYKSALMIAQDKLDELNPEITEDDVRYVDKKRAVDLLKEAERKKRELFENIFNSELEDEYTSLKADRAALRFKRAEYFKSFVHPNLLSSIRFSVPKMIGINYLFAGRHLSPFYEKGPANYTALGYAAHLGRIGAVEALAQAGVSFLEPGNSAGASVSAIASRAGHKVLADKLAIMAAKEVARIDPVYRKARSELIVKNKNDFGADIVNSIFSFIAIPGVFPPVAPPPPQRPPPPPLAVEEAAAESSSKRQRR